MDWVLEKYPWVFVGMFATVLAAVLIIFPPNLMRGVGRAMPALPRPNFRAMGWLLVAAAIAATIYLVSDRAASFLVAVGDYPLFLWEYAERYKLYVLGFVGAAVLLLLFGTKLTFNTKLLKSSASILLFPILVDVFLLIMWVNWPWEVEEVFQNQQPNLLLLNGLAALFGWAQSALAKGFIHKVSLGTISALFLVTALSTHPTQRPMMTPPPLSTVVTQGCDGMLRLVKLNARRPHIEVPACAWGLNLRNGSLMMVHSGARDARFDASLYPSPGFNPNKVLNRIALPANVPEAEFEVVFCPKGHPFDWANKRCT